MAEDPIAHNELDALTRRVEGLDDRVRREVRDGFTKIGARFDALEAKMDRNQAQIVELLTALVGKNPNEN
ncbi:hypothetical protein ACWCV5_32705 [Streptomyces tubercidicus]